MITYTTSRVRFTSGEDTLVGDLHHPVGQTGPVDLVARARQASAT